MAGLTHWRLSAPSLRAQRRKHQVRLLWGFRLRPHGQRGFRHVPWLAGKRAFTPWRVKHALEDRTAALFESFAPSAPPLVRRKPASERSVETTCQTLRSQVVHRSD